MAGSTGPKRGKKAKPRDERPARKRYTASHAWEANKIRKVRRQWEASLHTYLKGPRRSVNAQGAVRLRPRRSPDLVAARALGRLTGRVPPVAATLGVTL